MFNTNKLANYLEETTDACKEGIKFLKACASFNEAWDTCTWYDLDWFLQWSNSYRRIKIEVQDQLDIHVTMLGIMYAEELDISEWRSAPRTVAQEISLMDHIVWRILIEAYPGPVYPDDPCSTEQYFYVENILKSIANEYMLTMVKQYFYIEMIIVDMADRILEDIHR